MLEKQKILDLISLNNLDDAIDASMGFNSSLPGFKDAVILIKGRLSSLKKDLVLGIIDSNDAVLRENRIRHELLELINGTLPSNQVVKNLSVDDFFPSLRKVLNATFSLKLDLPVAKSMEPLSSFENFLMLFQDLFSNESAVSDTDSGHVTRCFDWDGITIWTPCDCRLASNIWRVNSGNHVAYVNKSKESYATLGIHKLGRNTIFGNGLTLYLESAHEIVQEISADEMPYDIFKLSTARNSGKEINTLLRDKDDIVIGVFRREMMSENFRYSQFKIESDQLVYKLSSWNIDLLELSNDRNVTLIYSLARNDLLSEVRDVLLVDALKNKILASNMLQGVQHISPNVQKNEIAILGKNLSILSLTDLKIKRERPLSEIRPNGEQGVLSYSTCGRFIAISYNFSGDVEIRSSDSLKVLCAFHGYGRPLTDISWNFTGQFIACRFSTREGKRHFPLVVWDVASQKEVLNIDTSVTYNDETVFRWAEHSTSIALLEGRKRVKVYELNT